MTPAPYPSLRVRYVASGVAGEANAIVDTGFDGYLAIPESLIGSLPEPTYRRRYRTASGESVVVAAFRGTVELVDLPGPIPARIIALGEDFLIGIQTLNHFRVTFDHGQRVIIEP
jgi:predicted aspartyl protease